MTMSVGLGRIVVDPSASVLVRKALGALSTPGLLVDDTSLTIDDNGRIIVRLKPDGGLVQDADGLYLETTVGIDSHVDLVSDEYDREWNARLTGTAPNFIESRLLIGSELENNAPGIIAAGQTLDEPMVNIWNSLTQLRLSFDQDKFTSFRTTPDGELQIFTIGSNTATTGIHLITGDGTVGPDTWGLEGRGGFRLNGASQVEIFGYLAVTVTLSGGGTAGEVSFEEFTSVITPHALPKANTAVSGGVTNITSGSSQIVGWSFGMQTDNTLSIRVSWFDVIGAGPQLTFLVGFTRFKAE